MVLLTIDKVNITFLEFVMICCGPRDSVLLGSEPLHEAMDVCREIMYRLPLC